MRAPGGRRGVSGAITATCRKAAERVEALAARYGASVVRAAVMELMDRAELRMRRAIGALPDGQYSYESHLETGRAPLEPPAIRARLTLAGGKSPGGLTGTPLQTAAPPHLRPPIAAPGASTILK